MNNFTVPILNKRDEYRFVERILKERIDKAKFNPLNILITIDNVQEFDTSVFCDALLLRQKYNEKIYITIIFDISGLNETYAFIDKISNLLIFEIVCHWGVQPQWIKIINKNEEVQLKNVKSVTRMGTLVPYIPINEETSAIFKKQIDYKLFLETANKFADLNKNDDRKKFVFGDIFNEFALHKIQNSYSNVHIGVLTQTIQQLADCGKKYFDDVLNINIIEDFTCFQAYMFAFLLLQQKNKYNNANKEERLQIIQNVKNSINLYSEALYEIIENVEHHAKKGYVFFRVYRDFKNNPYLKREYHDYSLLHTNKDNNQQDNKIIPVEVVVCDNSDNGILKEFHKKSPNTNLSLNEIFHRTGDFWNNVNRSRHCGMQAFLENIYHNDAYFSLITSDINKTEKYSEVENISLLKVNNVQIQPISNVISGSRYSILLPMLHVPKKRAVMELVATNIPDEIQVKADFNNYYLSNIVFEGGYLGQLAKDKTVKDKADELSRHIDLPNNDDLQKNFIAILNINYSQIQNKSVFQRSIFQLIDLLKEKKCVGSNKNYENQYIVLKIEFPKDNDLSEEEISALLKGKNDFGFIRYKNTNLWLQQKAKNDLCLELALPADLTSWTSSNGMTLFEADVENMLNNEFGNEYEGYKLTDAHVRLGNSLDINDFIFGEALFANGFYECRFALLLANKIYQTVEKSLENNGNNHICLVGYDVYSEQLVFHVKRILSSIHGISEKKLSTIFYDTTAEPSVLKYFNENIAMYNNNTYFVYIVPIGSTLNTFRKVDMKLKGEIRRNSTDEKLNAKCNKPEILSGDFNYCLMLIDEEDDRPNLQKYFILNSNRTCKVKIKPQFSVYYMVRHQTKYQEPLSCLYCFPNDLKYEKPLLRTNKASVVPIVQHHVNEHENENIKIDLTALFNSEIDNLKRMECLLNKENENTVIKYDHYCRGKNHYQYYIKTDVLFDHIIKNDMFIKNLDHWLNGIKENIDGANNNRHIVIAPRHPTNAQFVDYVCDKVFGDDKTCIIRIESEKEYRSNFKIKFRQIKDLIQSWKQNDYNVFLHYVDDTLISGGTYRRTMSLAQYLFNEKTDAQNVIVLLNRMSKSSKTEYVAEVERFHVFLEISVPSLRVFKNACPLCQYKEDQEQLIIKSTGTKVIRHFTRKATEFNIKNIVIAGNKNEKRGKEQENKENEERSVRRFFAAHYAHRALQNCTNKDTAKMIIESLIEEDSLYTYQNYLREIWGTENPSAERKISYIKVLSRPFLNYHYAVKRAITELFIEMMNELVDDIIEKNYEDPNYYGIKSYDRAVFMALLSALSQNESNYIIRGKNIYKLYFCAAKLEYSKIENEHEAHKDKTDLITRLICNIKQLISTPGDAIKSAWLEHLLINGYEYQDINNKFLYKENEYKYNNIVNNKDEFNTFIERLYMENTPVFKDAINNLCKRYDILRSENTIKDWNNFWSELNLYEEDQMRFDHFSKLTKEIFENINTQELFKRLITIKENIKEAEEKIDNPNNTNPYKSIVTAYKDLISDYIKSVSLFVRMNNEKNYNIVGKGSQLLDNECNQLQEKGFIINDEKGFLIFNNAEYPADSRIGEHIEHKRPKMQEIIMELNFNSKINPMQKLFVLQLFGCFRYDMVKLFEKDFSNNNYIEKKLYEEFRESLATTRTITHQTANKVREYFSATIDPMLKNIILNENTNDNVNNTLIFALHQFTNQSLSQRSFEVLQYQLQTELNNIIDPKSKKIYSLNNDNFPMHILKPIIYDEKFTAKGLGLDAFFKLLNIGSEHPDNRKLVIVNKYNSEETIENSFINQRNLAIIKDNYGNQFTFESRFLQLLFKEMAFSALQHGYYNKNHCDYVKIKIEEKDGFIIFSNLTCIKPDETQIKKLDDLCKQGVRIYEGASLYTFWHIFNIIKNCSDLSEGASYEYENNEMFIAKFPIFKKET